MASLTRPEERPAPIRLGPLLARSSRFKALFADGMKLVEETAGYLDGPGRDEAAGLEPALADAYSAESMRLTSRLMQIASWLLVRRALVDGVGGQPDSSAERIRASVTAQPRATATATFLQLPFTLQRLTERSLRLQRRVLHLDHMMADENVAVDQPPPAGLQAQYALLRSAFERAE